MFEELKQRHVYKKPDEEVIIYAKACINDSGGYHPRWTSDGDITSFFDYFKNRKFCCDSLKRHCDKKEYVDTNTFIEYDRTMRMHFIGGCEIFHCPFCGTRFLKGLSSEWNDTVVEEFGEEYLSEPLINSLPEEFKTDEWWIKRGL